MEQNRMRASIRYGLLVGRVTVFLGVLDGLISGYMASRPTGDLGILRLGDRILIIAFLALTTGAGALTARRTGEIRSGAIAGGTAAMCGAVSYSLVIALAFALQHGGILEGSQSATVAFIVFLLITAPCLIVVGLGLGSLGAVFGRARFRRLHAHVDRDTLHP